MILSHRVMDSVINQLKECNQEHLLKFFDQIDEKEQNAFLKELKETQWNKLSNIYKTQVLPFVDNTAKVNQTVSLNHEALEPLRADSVGGTTRFSEDEKEKCKTLGLMAISNSKVCVLVLAGGQGTRLGVDYPKGMYNIGLLDGKSLFELQASRIKLLIDETGGNIVWYLMTSLATMKPTLEFFKDKGYFGLNPKNVVIFEQNNIPCLDFNGKVLLDQKGKLAKSPDGNGGIFEVLHEQGIIEDMMSRGIEHVHVHSVDNVLVRVCDPLYIGYCISKEAEVGAKVVEKVDPRESVGTICMVEGKYRVIEYSEIPVEVASQRDPVTGKLLFSAANICDQYFRVQFLASLKDKPLGYHIAIKKIPHIHLETGERVNPNEPNGIKLEKFIFDVFELSQKFVAWEVSREDEFSPVKNARGTSKDNPDTALAALKRAYSLGLLRS